MHDLRIIAADEFPESFVEPPYVPRDQREEESWLQMFHDPDRDKYDWNDPEFLKRNEGPYGFLPVYLTQGFFMIVLRKDFERITTYPDGRKKKWRVRLDRDKEGYVCKAYAMRDGRKNEDEPDSVYAHRELLGCLFAPGDVDHINGWSLDNRGEVNKKKPINLCLVTTRTNSHNVLRGRTIHLGLQFSGVEKRGKNRKGKQRYGGKVCVRFGKKVKTYRSKRTWLTEEPANRWYRNKLYEINEGRKMWAHAPSTVNFPVFPPRADTEPTERSVQLRAKNLNGHSSPKILEDVPF
jgi:hypothetical protein